jgi:hypothetical protein
MCGSDHFSKIGAEAAVGNIGTWHVFQWGSTLAGLNCREVEGTVEHTWRPPRKHKLIGIGGRRYVITERQCSCPYVDILYTALQSPYFRALWKEQEANKNRAVFRKLTVDALVES